ncbi:MAG: hypothetical protein U0798_12335 [Gemmataceae bacterium]
MRKLAMALRHPILWFRAVILNHDSAICRLSVGMGPDDFHTPDDEDYDSQWDLNKVYCKRCGKCFSRHRGRADLNPQK